MKTVLANAEEAQKQRKWVLVDAEGQTLGRLATKIAVILRGKDEPTFTPHVDTGDFVVVVNAEKVVLTGKKLTQKTYNWHSGYPGGIKGITAGNLLKKKPAEVVKKAVWGMLPKGRLGKRVMTKLKVYAGPEHPHQAQQPVKITV